jgi:hypothetical protein
MKTPKKRPKCECGKPATFVHKETGTYHCEDSVTASIRDEFELIPGIKAVTIYVWEPE